MTWFSYGLFFNNIKHAKSPDQMPFLSLRNRSNTWKQVIPWGLEPGVSDHLTCFPVLLPILPTPGTFPPQQPHCTLHTSPFIKSPGETSLCNAEWLRWAARAQLVAQGTLVNWPVIRIRGIFKWNKAIYLFELGSSLTTIRYVSASFSKCLTIKCFISAGETFTNEIIHSLSFSPLVVFCFQVFPVGYGEISSYTLSCFCLSITSYMEREHPQTFLWDAHSHEGCSSKLSSFYPRAIHWFA